MAAVDEFLKLRKYNFSSSTGEAIYRKHGTLRAPQYINVEFKKTEVHIEAWIKFIFWKNIYAGEFDFKGYSGLYTRRNIKKDVKNLEKTIQAFR